MTKINRRLIAFLTLCLAVPLGLQAQVTDLATFNGATGRFPQGGLILSQDGSTLYGTTDNGGANGAGEVFSIPVAGGTPTVLASFSGSNGSNPMGGLLLSQDGSTLYGTTRNGGANNDGVVFSLSVSGGAPTILTSFNGTNGRVPMAGLTLSGSNLYGTTYYGGANDVGEVFSLSVSGGTPTILTSFNGADGQSPVGRLVLSGGTLYGAAQNGGSNNAGAVYALPIGGGTPTILANFNNTNGAAPVSGLVLSPNGSTFYGVTTSGGAKNEGAVYSLPIGGGTPTLLTSFDLTPGDGLALSEDGSTLYGEVHFGGANGDGVIYSLPVNGGTPTDLADFNGMNGDEPVGELALSGDTLYGVTNGGGANGDGVVFSVPAPEPGCAGLLLIGSLATMVRRRRGRSVA
jgi:uncharacterized repeat protein (TIGR03803 family)